MYILFFINDLTKWQCTPALSPAEGERETLARGGLQLQSLLTH
jgi:hypothetical protein